MATNAEVPSKHCSQNKICAQTVTAVAFKADSSFTSSIELKRLPSDQRTHSWFAVHLLLFPAYLRRIWLLLGTMKGRSTFFLLVIAFAGSISSHYWNWTEEG